MSNTYCRSCRNFSRGEGPTNKNATAVYTHTEIKAEWTKPLSVVHAATGFPSRYIREYKANIRAISQTSRLNCKEVKILKLASPRRYDKVNIHIQHTIIYNIQYTTSIYNIQYISLSNASVLTMSQNYSKHFSVSGWVCDRLYTSHSL